MKLTICPHCKTRVLLTQRHECPSCRLYVAEPNIAEGSSIDATASGEAAITSPQPASEVDLMEQTAISPEERVKVFRQVVSMFSSSLAVGVVIAFTAATFYVALRCAADGCGSSLLAGILAVSAIAFVGAFPLAALKRKFPYPSDRYAERSPTYRCEVALIIGGVVAAVTTPLLRWLISSLSNDGALSAAIGLQLLPVPDLAQPLIVLPLCGAVVMWLTEFTVRVPAAYDAYRGNLSLLNASKNASIFAMLFLIPVAIVLVAMYPIAYILNHIPAELDLRVVNRGGGKGYIFDFGHQWITWTANTVAHSVLIAAALGILAGLLTGGVRILMGGRKARGLHGK